MLELGLEPWSNSKIHSTFCFSGPEPPPPFLTIPHFLYFSWPSTLSLTLFLSLHTHTQTQTHEARRDKYREHTGSGSTEEHRADRCIWSRHSTHKEHGQGPPIVKSPLDTGGVGIRGEKDTETQ